MVALFGAPQSESENKQLNSNAENRTSSVNNSLVAEKASVTDDTTESSVLANLAESANLAVAPSTASLSASVTLLQETPQTAKSIEKPKILEVSSEKREIIKYTTSSEENIQELANKYGITAQTIKWVNNIKGDTIPANKEIRILPVDGITYIVKSGDTLASIAEKYQASIERISSYNTLKDGEEPKEGVEIVIPGGILPEKDRPDYVTPTISSRSSSRSATSVSTTSSSSYSTVVSSNYNVKSGNAYAWGNCTWYVYNLRPDIGSFWGNATSWAVSARAAGYQVDHTPTVGSIAQWNAYAGGMSGWGHVAYVKSVNGDGTITVTEMNVRGLAVVSERTITASSVSNFIH